MKKLKLNVLNNQELKRILGGSNSWKGGCGCGCRYENNGGSSTVDNAGANDAKGIIGDGAKTITLPEVVIYG